MPQSLRDLGKEYNQRQFKLDPSMAIDRRAAEYVGCQKTVWRAYMMDIKWKAPAILKEGLLAFVA